MELTLLFKYSNNRHSRQIIKTQIYVLFIQHANLLVLSTYFWIAEPRTNADNDLSVVSV